MADNADGQNSFDWAGSPPPDPALAPQPQARRRVQPRWVAAVVGVAALAGVLAVVLSSGGGAPAASGGPVALAASVSSRAAGYRFTSQISGSVAGTSFSVNGSGAINLGPPVSGSLTETVGSVTVSERIVGSSIYVQSPTSPGRWLRIDLPGFLGSIGDSPSTSLSGDPSQTVALLRNAGSVTDVGPEAIDGVNTEHYHALVDLSRYASTLPASQQAAAEQNAQRFQQLTGSSTLPVDVWIDGAQLVRRVHLGLSINTKLGALAESVTTTFSDYGPQERVAAPPDSEVTDISGQVNSRESQALSQLGAGSSTPSPPSVATVPAATTPATTTPATTTPSYGSTTADPAD